jgi:hypothetical protein
MGHQRDELQGGAQVLSMRAASSSVRLRPAILVQAEKVDDLLVFWPNERRRATAREQSEEKLVARPTSRVFKDIH